MTAPPPQTEPALRAEQRERLRVALMLVRQMAGMKPDIAPNGPEVAARAYAAATPIARRRFDALAGEAGAFAAAGIAALIRHRDARGRDCAPAAAQLADDISRALTALDRLIPPA
jgi:hypothetical protein